MEYNVICLHFINVVWIGSIFSLKKHCVEDATIHMHL
jgi:hypothetical protein